MLDYPKLEEYKKGGKIKIINKSIIKKKKMKQKQTQKQIVNVYTNAPKRTYRRQVKKIEPQQRVLTLAPFRTELPSYIYSKPSSTLPTLNPPQQLGLPTLQQQQLSTKAQEDKLKESKLLYDMMQQITKMENFQQNEEQNEEQKPFIPADEEYYNNFLDDDFRNVNIMNAPISNPLADDSKLPSFSLSFPPLPPLPPLPQLSQPETEDTENDADTYPSVKSIREMAKNYTNRPLTKKTAKEEILNMDVGYTEKMLNKLSATEINYLVPYIKSRIKDINRGEGQKKKGRPRKSN